MRENLRHFLAGTLTKTDIPFARISSAALMDLFVAILKQLLVEELYPATAAELNHEIYTSDKGIVVKVNGFNQKLPVRARLISP